LTFRPYSVAANSKTLISSPSSWATRSSAPRRQKLNWIDPEVYLRQVLSTVPPTIPD
jgi:hypothetical protein